MGRLGEIRKIAFFAETGGYAFHKVKALLAAISSRFDLPDIIMVELSRTNRHMYLFDKSEEEILEALGKVKAKKKGKTSPKVLARMVRDRLVKIHGFVVETRNDRYRSHMKIPPLSWEVLAKAKTEDSRVLEKHFDGVSYRFRDKIKECTRTIQREDITLEILREGWDLFEVAGVMDS